MDWVVRSDYGRDILCSVLGISAGRLTVCRFIVNLALSFFQVFAMNLLIVSFACRFLVALADNIVYIPSYLNATWEERENEEVRGKLRRETLERRRRETLVTEC